MSEDEDGSSKKPAFDPDRALATNGLWGLLVTAAWTLALVFGHESHAVAACVLAVGAVLLLGWLPAMRGWIATSNVLRVQAVCFFLAGVAGIVGVSFAIFTHASFRYTPGICTAAIRWALRVWCFASDWRDEDVERASFRVTVVVGSIEGLLFVCAIVAMVRLMP